MMTEYIQFMLQHWAMIGALAVVLFLILINEIQFFLKKGKELSIEEAIQLINHENATVIDIRDAESFQKNHILDSIRASEEDFTGDKMNSYKEKPFILVCTRGITAATLATKLRSKGFAKPYVLSGGITAWQSAQLPLIKGKN
mgnify:CR=1 FL=1